MFACISLSNPLVLPRPFRMPSQKLKPTDKVGYFRPQLGFTPPDQSRTYSTPKNVQRFISSSLSDPKSSHQPPQGHGSQQLSWQSFEEPWPIPQRVWSMQAPPHPHPTTPHTMMVIEGDLAGNHPEVNITMVSYHCGYMLCLLTHSQVDPSSITCCVLHNDGEAHNTVFLNVIFSWWLKAGLPLLLHSLEWIMKCLQ